MLALTTSASHSPMSVGTNSNPSAPPRTPPPLSAYPHTNRWGVSLYTLTTSIWGSHKEGQLGSKRRLPSSLYTANLTNIDRKKAEKNTGLKLNPPVLVLLCKASLYSTSTCGSCHGTYFNLRNNSLDHIHTSIVFHLLI